MREEVEKRVLRVLINVAFIAVIVMALVFLDISFPYIVVLVPTEGFTLTRALGLLAIVVLFFFALRVILDLTKLIDVASASFLRHIPGLNPDKGSSITRALKELTLVFIIAIAASLASPVISSIPRLGGWIGLAFSVACLVVSLALMYDAGKTLYATFESSIQLLIERMTTRNEKTG